MTLPTNYVNNVGMLYDADAINEAHEAVNDNTAAIADLQDALAGSGGVATSETTGSSSYTNLTTTTDQATVIVPASGTVLVIAQCDAALSSGSFVNGAPTLSVALSGANTVAASDTNSAKGTAGTTNLLLIKRLTGLTPGATVFAMRYKTTQSGGTPAYAYSNRSIAAFPLP